MIYDARDRLIAFKACGTISATATHYLSPAFPFPVVVKRVSITSSTANTSHTGSDFYTVQITAVTANKDIMSTAYSTLYNASTNAIAAATLSTVINGSVDQNKTINADDTLKVVFTKGASAPNLTDCVIQVEFAPA